MSGKTEIQWADEVWNPVVGCKRVSEGCDSCYAFALHDKRHIAWKRGNWPTAPAQYHLPFSQVQLLPERLGDPLHWRKPRRIFVNSVSDLFHEQVPGSFINDVWMTMRNAKQHTYIILTKRPERMLEWTRTKARATGWPINEIWPDWIWVGVSVENQRAADERVPLLLDTPAAVRFLSCEPLLSAVDLTRVRCPNMPHDKYCSRCCNDYHPLMFGRIDALQEGIDWVIAGGESGPRARPIALNWVEDIIEQCRSAGTPVFVKQMGSMWARMQHAKDGHGGAMEEWPEHLRIREFPQTAVGVPA